MSCKSAEGHGNGIELVSKTTTKIVNLNHMKEFQECMDSYKLAMGYIHSIQLLLLLNFMNAPEIFILLPQRVQPIIISNIPANNTQDVIFIFHLVVTMVLDCCTSKNAIF